MVARVETARKERWREMGTKRKRKRRKIGKRAQELGALGAAVAGEPSARAERPPTSLVGGNGSLGIALSISGTPQFPVSSPSAVRSLALYQSTSPTALCVARLDSIPFRSSPRDPGLGPEPSSLSRSAPSALWNGPRKPPRQTRSFRRGWLLPRKSVFLSLPLSTSRSFLFSTP